MLQVVSHAAWREYVRVDVLEMGLARQQHLVVAVALLSVVGLQIRELGQVLWLFFVDPARGKELWHSIDPLYELVSAV